MHTHPLGPIGSVFQLVAVVVSGVLGFYGKPALISMFVGGLLFAVGYVFVRLPQMLGVYRNDGAKVLLAILYLIIGNSVLSAILYGIGWLVSWVLH